MQFTRAEARSQIESLSTAELDDLEASLLSAHRLWFTARKEKRERLRQARIPIAIYDPDSPCGIGHVLTRFDRSRPETVTWGLWQHHVEIVNGHGWAGILHPDSKCVCDNSGGFCVEDGDLLEHDPQLCAEMTARAYAERGAA